MKSSRQSSGPRPVHCSTNQGPALYHPSRPAIGKQSKATWTFSPSPRRTRKSPSVGSMVASHSPIGVSSNSRSSSPATTAIRRSSPGRGIRHRPVLTDMWAASITETSIRESKPMKMLRKPLETYATGISDRGALIRTASPVHGSRTGRVMARSGNSDPSSSLGISSTLHPSIETVGTVRPSAETRRVTRRRNARRSYRSVKECLRD